MIDQMKEYIANRLLDEAKGKVRSGFSGHMYEEYLEGFIAEAFKGIQLLTGMNKVNLHFDELTIMYQAGLVEDVRAEATKYFKSCLDGLYIQFDWQMSNYYGEPRNFYKEVELACEMSYNSCYMAAS